jgi:hypothetical protein
VKRPPEGEGRSARDPDRKRKLVVVGVLQLAVLKPSPILFAEKGPELPSLTWSRSYEYEIYAYNASVVVD